MRLVGLGAFRPGVMRNTPQCQITRRDLRDMCELLKLTLTLYN